MVVKMKSKDTTVGTIFKSRKSKTFNNMEDKVKKQRTQKKKNETKKQQHSN